MYAKNNRYLPLYVALAALTMLLCVYVMNSFVRNKAYRKPPAPLMLSKTMADLIFSLVFFVMLVLVDTHNNLKDNEPTSACTFLGPMFITAFIASQAYFTAICWDLYRTLSNPFRKPAADSVKMHFFVWLFGIILAAACAPFGAFRYRSTLGICFSCNTGSSLNYYNLVLFYIPIFNSNVSGFAVAVFAFHRLSNGLEKTFELRQQIIKRQVILVLCLFTVSVITVISWSVVIYAPSFGHHEECEFLTTNMCLNVEPVSCADGAGETQAETLVKPRILLSILVFLNGFFDAVAWFFLQSLTKQSGPRIAKYLDIGSSQQTQTEMLITDNLPEPSETDVSSESDSKQNVSNALRNEIITYMTAGLAESAKNVATDTYERLCAYSAYDMDLPSMNELNFEELTRSQIQPPAQTVMNANNSSNDTQTLQEQHTLRQHSQQTSPLEQALQCEEPEPQRARFPIHVNHDPKTHKGVVNEVLIQLPTQQVRGSVYTKIRNRIPISSSSNAKKSADLIKVAGLEEPSVERVISNESAVSAATTGTSSVMEMSERHTRKNTDHKLGILEDTLTVTASPIRSAMSPTSARKDGVPFKDYAPHVFRYLRQQIYGIADADYLSSIRPPTEEQAKQVQEKFSEGRSGAFFFFTHDSKYIIKTVNKSEAALLLKILPSLVQHFGTHRKSLVNRFFGLHSLTMYNLCLYFVVLENVFVAGAKPHEIYDIKGSWIDRHTHHHVESGKLMKDGDLHKTLKLQPEIADDMFAQLREDSKFLQTHNIMDYSVLLGIYYVGIDPGDVQRGRVMLHTHDNVLNSERADLYNPPSACKEEEEEKAEIEQVVHTLGNGYDGEEQEQDDLLHLSRQLTTDTLPDDAYVEQEKRPRAPSFHTGLRKYAQKEKAVQARVIEGPGIYYLGIIDVLQEWNSNKKLERMAKVYLRCKSKNGISCVEPKYYRKRFLKKMQQIGIRKMTSDDR